MPSPSNELVTSRPDLATMHQIDLEMQARNYIGLELFPDISTPAALGTFNVVTLASLLAASDEDLARASGSGWDRGKFTFEGRSFVTVMRGCEEPLDDDERSIYEEIIDGEMVCVARAFERLLSNIEKRVIKMAVTDTVTAGQTTSAGTSWATHATAVPVTNVMAAGQAVRDRTGMYPNTVAMSRPTWRNLIQCSQIHDRLGMSTGSNSNTGSITQEAIAELFDVDKVVVANSVKLNGSAVASIFPDNQVWCGVVAKNKNDFREPCVGRSVIHKDSVAGGEVEQYYQAEISSEVYRVKSRSTELSIYSELADVITGV